MGKKDEKNNEVKTAPDLTQTSESVEAVTESGVSAEYRPPVLEGKRIYIGPSVLGLSKSVILEDVNSGVIFDLRKKYPDIDKLLLEITPDLGRFMHLTQISGNRYSKAYKTIGSLAVKEKKPMIQTETQVL